jgi:hypothetical protein
VLVCGGLSFPWCQQFFLASRDSFIPERTIIFVAPKKEEERRRKNAALNL